MSSAANILITHQKPEAVARMLDWWGRCVPADSLWLAYGGPRGIFDVLPCRRKFFLESDRIRVSDPQRQHQSYAEVFQKAVEAGALEGCDFVHLAEYDQLPLQPDLNTRQREFLEREAADVIAYRLQRIDQTNNPHFLYHWHRPEFREFLRRISVRSQPDVVLSFVGFGSFWRAEAFRSLAQVSEPCPVYLEIFMASVAHHLGWRLRKIAEPERYNATDGDNAALIDEARAAGAWNLHPVKSQWNGSTI
jgi:hypothetical protein